MAGMISVTSKIFFDKPSVTNAMDRKTQRVLSATGAFARTVMKRGMRKQKGVSAPGDYPSSHKGQLRNLIYFGYDASTQSVVVGPTLFKSPVGGKTIPELLNEGGTVTVTKKTKRGQKRVSQHYRPRPSVTLTLPAAAGKLAENMEKFDLK